MPDPLSLSDVERLAALAQLELTDAEKQLFMRQLAEILAYAEQVQQLDTTGVPATAHIDAAHGVERDDEPRPSLPIDAAVGEAPEAAHEAGLFRVPRVIN